MTIAFSCVMNELKFGQWINVFIFFSVIVLYNIFSIFEIKLESIKASMPCIMIWQFPSVRRKFQLSDQTCEITMFWIFFFCHPISISEYWCLMCLLHYKIRFNDFCNLGNTNRTILCCYLSHSKSIPTIGVSWLSLFFFVLFNWVVWLWCPLFAMVLV